MRGVYLSYVPASSEGGKRKLEARIEEHVSICVNHCISVRCMLRP